MDYLSAAIESATKEDQSGNFDFDTSRILSASQEEKPEIIKENKEIQIASPELPEVNIPGLPSTNTLGKNTIQNSDLNTILDYDNYQLLINKINLENKTKYGNNWASIPSDKSFFHTELLGSAYIISTILIQGRIDGGIKWDRIQQEMVNIFKILLSLTIKNSNEVPLYSILTAQQSIFDNAPGSKIELFDSTFWEMFLIPLMLKQDQLLGIKFMEFWLYLGTDFKSLFKTIQEG